ncbi:hypothetical protein [Streptomyces mirabilis]|uniref:hypothetical protein n=1 Tax=Streptomyces mirabilis TaxID=68239 RepID=UPI0033B1916D
MSRTTIALPLAPMKPNAEDRAMCPASFALEELRTAFVGGALRSWQKLATSAGAEGIAHGIVRFVALVLSLSCVFRLPLSPCVHIRARSEPSPRPYVT